jgi:hypothetical protein
VPLGEPEQLAVELERTIGQLARDTWARDGDWCRARLAEFADEGDVEHGRRAELWFLLDCPLPEGHTPIWRMRQERADRAVELLARSEFRAWRIESPLGAVCPLTRARVRLQVARGGLEPGSVVVGRSVPLGPERWLVLGAGSWIAAPDAAAFERLIASLSAPAAEFWRVHGGVLARAALDWPSQALRIAA